MTQNKRISNEAADLRQRAEERLRIRTKLSSQELESLPSEALLKILHDVCVDQIQLEMQNEDLHHAQVELKNEFERYYNLYDLAPVGHVTLSEKGVMLETNLTASELLGVSRDMLVKKPFHNFVRKEDQHIYLHNRKLLFDSGEPQNCDLQMVKNDGTPFFAHLAATLARDEDGTPVCRAVISDITERKRFLELQKETNQRMIDILESMTDAFFTLDGSLVINYFNAAAERLLNRNRLDVLGQKLFEVFPEAKGSIFEEKYSQAIREKITQSFETYFGEKPYENWYDVRVFPLQDGISVYFQIVTERKKNRRSVEAK
jgi:PAS domain S-box-containing protein